MPRQVVDLDVVRELALALPDVEEATSWGATSFKVGGRMIACQAIHSSAEDRTLMVRIDKSLRDELLATEPDVYYLTPHYAPYPALLVRLDRVNRASLRKLLGTACVFAASPAPTSGATRRRKKTKAAPTRPARTKRSTRASGRKG